MKVRACLRVCRGLIVVSRRHAEVTKIHELRSVRSACTRILTPLVRARVGDIP